MLRILIYWTLILFAASLVFGVPQPGMAQETPSASDPEDASENKDGVSAKGQSELSLFEDIPVVVTASRKPERITEAPSIISVITAENIERMGFRTITDVLRTIPGIEIIRDDANLLQIAVRGLRSEASTGVKMLVDGHALNDPITGGATELYDDLSLHNIQRIEIIRGPASALYGANAFVSVINVITKRARDIQGVDMSLGVGSANTWNPSLLIGKTFNDIECILHADYMTTDGTKQFMQVDMLSVYDEIVRPAGYEPLSEAPGFFQEEEEKFMLSSTLKYKDLTWRGSFLYKERGPFLTEWHVLNKHSDEEGQHAYVHVDYQRFLTERLKLDASVYADYFDLERWEQVAPGFVAFPEDIRPGQGVHYPDGLINQYAAEGWRVGAEAQVDFRLWTNNDLTVGLAYEYSAVEHARLKTNQFNASNGRPPNELYDIDEIYPATQHSSYQHFAAIFAQDTWKIRRDLELTIGERVDFYSEFGGVVTPKIGLIYEPLSRFNVKTLFGSAFRVPSFMESSISISEEGEPEELVVEELLTFEIGMGFKPWKWLFGGINYFYTDINELAEVAEDEVFENDEEEGLDIYPIETTQTYVNVGGIEVQGVEVEIHAKSEHQIDLGIIPRLISSTFSLNYSYQDTQDSLTHEHVPNMARHKGNIGVGLNLSAEATDPGKYNPLRLFRTLSDEFSLYGNLFLCGKRPRGADDPREAVEGFALLDLTLNAYDIFQRGFDISLHIKNVLDSEYFDPVPLYILNDSQRFPDDYPNPGRSYFLNLRYTF